MLCKHFVEQGIFFLISSRDYFQTRETKGVTSFIKRQVLEILLRGENASS